MIGGIGGGKGYPVGGIIAYDPTHAVVADGVGEAAFSFTATAGSAFSRIPSRVIIGVPYAKRGLTAIGSRASRTRIGVPRSHTEITNG